MVAPQATVRLLANSEQAINPRWCTYEVRQQQYARLLGCRAFRVGRNAHWQ
jgi:hypothetical protein